MLSKFIVFKYTEADFILIGIILCTSLFLCKRLYAAYAEDLGVDAEAEYTFSDFQRDPEPTKGSTGTNISQEYRLYIEGGLLKEGLLDSEFGVSLDDKFREDDIDFENRVRFDYGKWLRIETQTRHETDEEIFFSGTTEPQSPIHTITKKYNSRLALSRASSIEYTFEENERRDLLIGTITGEKTETQTVRFTTDRGPLSLSGEYRQTDFDDLLGERSDIESEDLNFDVSWRPTDYFNLSAFFEDSKDADLENNTELQSQDSRIEFMVKPLKELKLRNRLKIRKDKNTDTGEDIANKSNELIVNFEPVKQIDFEAAYKREDEDKDRDSTSIDSTIDEERLKVRLSPITGFDVQSGYEISDKESTKDNENLKNTKLFADISYEPVASLRIGGNFTNTKQKNTFTSLTESDTKSISGSLQYRLPKKMSLFLQFDSSKTDNPPTGAFTKTDTVSSNFDIEAFSFLNMALRTSGQETSGSSESSESRRLLNALEFNIKFLKDLKVSTEYEFIDSSGTTSSDEDLFDIAVFYNVGRLDFSLRFQERSVTGDSPTDKTTVLSNVKYRFSKSAVLSFRFSLIDYTDKTTPANSYDSTTVESALSMRF